MRRHCRAYDHHISERRLTVASALRLYAVSDPNSLLTPFLFEQRPRFSDTKIFGLNISYRTSPMYQRNYNYIQYKSPLKRLVLGWSSQLLSGTRKWTNTSEQSAPLITNMAKKPNQKNKKKPRISHVILATALYLRFWELRGRETLGLGDE